MFYGPLVHRMSWCDHVTGKRLRREEPHVMYHVRVKTTGKGMGR